MHFDIFNSLGMHHECDRREMELEHRFVRNTGNIYTEHNFKPYLVSLLPVASIPPL